MHDCWAPSALTEGRAILRERVVWEGFAGRCCVSRDLQDAWRSQVREREQQCRQRAQCVQRSRGREDGWVFVEVAEGQGGWGLRVGRGQDEAGKVLRDQSMQSVEDVLSYSKCKCKALIKDFKQGREVIKISVSKRLFISGKWAKEGICDIRETWGILGPNNLHL